QRIAIDRSGAAASRTAHPHHPHRLRQAGRCGQADRYQRTPHRCAVIAAKEVAMETNETANTVFTPLADDAFLSLGTQQIAYIKAVDLPDGAHGVAIFSADGKPMPQAAPAEIAQALLRQHELDPALVH